MKLTDYENEDALDLLVDILEPVSAILVDKKVEKAFKDNIGPMEIVKLLLKEHKKEIIVILATVDGVSVENYHGTLITMTKQLLEIINDKELIDFFHSQGLIQNSL